MTIRLFSALILSVFYATTTSSTIENLRRNQISENIQKNENSPSLSNLFHFTKKSDLISEDSIPATSELSLQPDVTDPLSETDVEDVDVSEAYTDVTTSGSTTIRGVMSLTNGASSNRLNVILLRGNSAPYYTARSTYATNGTGTGTTLNNTGSIAVKGNLVFVVNPGSNSITSFLISSNGTLQRRSNVQTGYKPVSLDVFGNLLVVLNFGNSESESPIYPSLQSFTFTTNGTLTAVSGGILTSNAVSSADIPAQVSFTPSGTQLVTTFQNDGFYSFSISSAGIITFQNTYPNGNLPLGFKITSNNIIVVAEMAGTVSSYRLRSSGAFTFVSTMSVGSGPGRIQLSSDEKFAFVSNQYGDTLTSLKVGSSGTLYVNQLVAANTNTLPSHMSLSSDGTMLALLTDTASDVQLFSVDTKNSALTYIQTITPLLAVSNGVALFSL